MKARTAVRVPAIALALLAGCALYPEHGPGGHGAGGMGMGSDDPERMCSLYRQMMAGRTPAEQQAAMEARMRSMHGGDVTPEQARMQREAMEKRCAAMSPPR